MSATDQDGANTRPGSTASTSLHANAFFALGATTRDDRRKIVELAESKSLETDGDGPHKARAALTTPRARLSQEIAWLPGVAPNKALELLASIAAEGPAISWKKGIPPLARANLTAAAFEAWEEVERAAMSMFAIDLAKMADEIDIDEVMRDINEDRGVAGFPEVSDRAAVEAEIAARRSVYLAAMKGALDRMESSELVETMLMMVKDATWEGQAPSLVDDLVDAYALEVEPVLSARSERIMAEIKRAADAAPDGKFKVGVAIDAIEELTRSWCALAKPIQLSAKARGTTDQSSFGIGGAIRGLGLTLNNDFHYVELAQRTTSLISELFADLPELAEIAERDAEKLLEIQESAAEAKRDSEEWERSITFRAEVGVLFKDELAIGPRGIEWKGRSYPLDSVTAVRWGGVRNSINGIPTGTDYKIGVATGSGSFQIELKKEATYSQFINCLWRAVCVRLVVEMVQALKSGKTLSFGGIVVTDTHIHLVRTKLFGANQSVQLDWSQVSIWSANGSVVIGAQNDKKLLAMSSYIDDWNAHILEHVVRGAFKKGVDRLSDYLL